MGGGVGAAAQTTGALAALPLRLEQVASRSSTVWRLVLVSPAVLGLAVAVGWAACVGAEEPAALSLVAERPFAALQIGFALAIWIAIFVWPASRALAGFWARRSVEITDQGVHITDAGLAGTRTHVVPLAGYLGIAHHIRASLSGLTHELILVHPDAAKTVTLHSADHISQATFESARNLLKLPEVPSRLLYERRSAPVGGGVAGKLDPVGA